MTTKEWLNRAYKLDNEIDMLIEEREQSFNRACGVSGNSSEGERVQASKRNLTADWTIAYIEYTQKIEQRMTELWEVKGEIFDIISKVENNTLRQLLICRYIKFMTWERVAERLEFRDVRHIYRVHKKALKKAGEVIPPPDKI